MNKKVMTLLYISATISIIFAILALVTFVFGLIYVIANEDWGSVLSLVYSFFHLLISIVAAYLAIKAVKSKKSIIMRTIMYVNDYKELDPSLPAKVIAIVLGLIGLFIGTYFGLSYLINNIVLFGWNWPMMFRLIMVNVGLYVFFLSIPFFIFPFIYDVKKDIVEMNDKRNKKIKEKQIEDMNSSEEE